jgi:hypothetical protein
LDLHNVHTNSNDNVHNTANVYNNADIYYCPRAINAYNNAMHNLTVMRIPATTRLESHNEELQEELNSAQARDQGENFMGKLKKDLEEARRETDE